MTRKPLVALGTLLALVGVSGVAVKRSSTVRNALYGAFADHILPNNSDELTAGCLKEAAKQNDGSFSENVDSDLTCRVKPTQTSVQFSTASIPMGNLMVDYSAQKQQITISLQELGFSESRTYKVTPGLDAMGDDPAKALADILVKNNPTDFIAEYQH